MIVVVGHQPGQEAPVVPLGGINIGGGVLQQTGSLRSSFQTIYCSDHTKKACRARGNHSFQCADYRRMIVFLCFQGEAARRPQCVASRFSGPVAIPHSETTAAVLSGTGQTRMKMRFCFFFPLFLLSSLISAASRENYTLLKDAVVFLATCQLKWFLKKLFPSPSAQHSKYRRSCRFPYFHR